MMVHQALIVSQSEWKRKISERIFEDLLNEQHTEKLLSERLSRISFSTEPPFYLILVKATPTQDAYQSFVEYLEDFFIHEPVLVGKYQFDEFFILTSEINEDILKKNLSFLANDIKKYANVKMGVGQVVDDLSKIRHAYETAKTAIEYSEPEQHITFFESVELHSLLKKKDSFEARHFTNRILNKVNPKLLHTLKLFLQCNQQFSVATEALDIHRHTLSYRLNQIYEQTGYNPTVFHDALVLQIALWLRVEKKKE